jgi:TonB family protein
MPEGKKEQRRAFCVDKDRHVFKEGVSPRVYAANVADYSCHYNQFWKFGNYWVPHEVVCFMDGRQRMEVRVVDLSAEPSPETALFTPPAGAVEIGDCSVTPEPPKAIFAPGAPSPDLPQMGDRLYSVVIRMVIDAKGKPQDLRITRSGGKERDKAALDTIRTWRFKPETCKGEPMPAQITVETKFWGDQ